jgi:hypothetical protein
MALMVWSSWNGRLRSCRFPYETLPLRAMCKFKVASR